MYTHNPSARATEAGRPLATESLLEGSGLFGGFVALAMVTLALLMRLLADYERLKSAYQPTVVISLAIAVFALGLAALDPPPLVLATLTFVAMCIQWVYAVTRWLGTTDGEAAVTQARQTGVLQDASDPEP